MQAFFWETVLARTKLGTAITAAKPMMPTTIKISTIVKPDLRDVLIFIFISNLSVLAARARQLVSYYYVFLFTGCPLITVPKMGIITEFGNPGQCWK